MSIDKLSRVEDILHATLGDISESELQPPQSRVEALLQRLEDKIDEISEGGGKLPIHICTSSEYNPLTGIPTIQNPVEDTFYLVPDGSGNNLYTEWIYTNGVWDYVGGTNSTGGDGSVHYDTVQSLSDGDKARARLNISAAEAGDVDELKSAIGDIAIEWIEGKYIKGDGSVESYSKYACTQFIPVYGTTVSLRTRIISNATYYAIAFYDANQAYIPNSGVINPSSSTLTFEGDVSIPSGAKYARCSCYKADVSDYFVFKLYDFIGNLVPQISSDSSKLGKAETELNNLKITEVTYTTIELSLNTGKYVYVGASPSNNDGTIQNSDSKAYMTVPVMPGEAVKVSGLAQPNAPILTFFSDTAINHANYIGAYEVLTGNKTYTDELIMIPDNCAMVAVSFSHYSTNTNAIKKSTATERVNQLWNAGYVKSSQISEYITTNPLQYRGRQACVFDNILCIGDSLTQGGENDPPNITPDEENASRTVTDEQYSYPTYLTKLWGCETTNWGLSGQTSVSWLAQKESSDWTGHDCAIVFLGSNDLNISDNVETCISTNNTTLRTIISRFKSDNVGAPVFICTLFKGWNDANGVSEGVVTNIRTIAAELPGVYLIDFRAYSDIKLPSVYTNTHPVAIGYEKMAEEIGGAISWYIKNYPDDFRWLRWVGTNKAVPITSA